MTTVPEDPIDLNVEEQLRRLPPNIVHTFTVKRIANGLYEVDGRRVGVGFQSHDRGGQKAYASAEGEEAQELATFLERAAQQHAERQVALGPGQMRPCAALTPPPLPHLGLGGL